MQAFSNIRVIDLTHVIAGPFCTYQLAVMGADVIKIESPDCPDISRAPSSPLGTQVGVQESDFTAQNANKRAVSIDLKSKRGKEILTRMIAGADVFVENYRSGALAEIGFGYAAVKAIRADIIYCSITGFGQDGALAERTAYDNVIQACSGLMAATGDADTAPLRVGPPVLDYGTGIQAAFAIAAALYQRNNTGKGQYIDVAMLDAAIMLMSSHVTYFQQHGKLAPTSGNDSTVNAGYACYPTQDGLLMLGAYSGKQVAAMWKLLGDPAHGAELESLPPSGMADHFERDQPRIAELLLAKSADEWEIEFNQHKVPAARVRLLDETLNAPHLDNRNVLQAVADTAHASDSHTPPAQQFPVAAFQYAENGPTLTRPPPTFAQHTKEVLLELGYTDDELQQLQARGAIAMSDV